MTKKIINALTVDVEDYFHVAAFSGVINTKDWSGYQSRVEVNTRSLLEIYAKYNVSATFFVLGWVAERYPGLVREIREAGHEVACHGYSHQLIYSQSRQEFREETLRAKKILENIIQEPVIGYRAASFSINKSSEWAIDILIESGFQYDSSIFPVRHDRYGMVSAPRFPYILNSPAGSTIIEYPMTTVRIMGTNVPVSGGGYFRLYPYWFTRASLSGVNRKEKQSFMFYLHPWEIDPQQPRIEAGWFSRFRHYNNLSLCQTRIEKLLQDFSFGTVKENLQTAGLLS